MAFEKQLREHVWGIARAMVVVFLVVAERRIADALPSSLKIGARRFRRRPAQARNLTTMFGVVRYSRTYMSEVVTEMKKRIRGFHPLDATLGLSADRFSMSVLALAARMATKMSYAEAKATLDLAIPTSPSTEVIQQTVLGLGWETEEWFELRPTPSGDGDVLIIMIDSKGIPMAGEDELDRRRGPRSEKEKAPSPRHRGRTARKRNPKKPRKASSDCSKNARMVNVIVMFTLRRDGRLLLGPINRWIYATLSTKDHAFQIARREADKRGFHRSSGKLIQVVTDGDIDLGRRTERYFPEATQTIDFIHVVEKLWEAGTAIHAEATPQHHTWVNQQRERLLDGKCSLVLKDLRAHKRAIPKTGPGNKGRHARLEKAISYIAPRLDQMNYASLKRRDLELSTGHIEGVIKHAIGKRCDQGGMRWIEERAQAVLQLRCIEVNGDWDAFIEHVHDRRLKDSKQGTRSPLQTREAKSVPTTPNAESHRRCRRRKELQRNAALAAAA